MPELEDARHERYAELRAHLNLGKREAYLQAGFKGRDPKASRLLEGRPDVAARIEELRVGFREKMGFTLEDASAQLRESWVQALKSGDIANQINAVNSRAKLHGIAIDRSISLTGDIAKLASLPRDDFHKLFELLDARRRSRLVAAGGSHTFPDQALQLQALPQAVGVSQAGGDPQGTPVHGGESVGENPVRGDGVGDAPDRAVPELVDGAEVRRAG